MNMSEFPEHLQHELWREFDHATHGVGGADSCPNALLLAAYLDDRLGATEQRDLEAHLADCAACRESLCEARFVLDQGSQTLSFVSAQIAAAAKLVGHSPANVGHAMAIRSAVRWRVAAGWCLVAAASSVICLLGYRAGLASPPSDANDDSLVAEMSFGVLDAQDDDEFDLALLDLGDQEVSQ